MNQQEQEQRATNAAPPFPGPSSLLEQLHEPGLGQGGGEGRGYYGALPQLDGLGTMPQLDGTLQAINGGMYAPCPQLQPGRAAHATQQFEGSATQTHAANDVQMFGSQPGGLGFLQEGFAFQPRMLGHLPSPYSGMMGTPGSTHGPGTPATPMTSRSMSPEINRSAALKTSGMDAAAQANGPQTGMSTPSQRAHPQGLMQPPQSQVLPNAAPSSPETARSSPETARSSPETARSSPEATRSSPETSRSASVAPPQIPIADQINTLLEDAANNAPLLSKNASLMRALLNFRMEYTPAVLGTLLSSMDEQIKRQVVSDTRQMIQSDTTSRNFEAVYARIAQLEAALADSNSGNASGSGSGGGRKKAEPVKSNDHGELKNLIHDLLWKLCGVKSSKDTKEGDKFEQLLDTPSDRVGMVEENGLTTWYPEWQARVDTRVNMEFLEYLVQQVFENDERMHKAGGLRRIPEKSRSLPVAAAIAKAFFQYVAGGLQLRRTDKGQERLDQSHRNTRQRARRKTKTEDRRESVKIFEELLGIVDAAQYIATDYASDMVSVRDDEMTDAIQQMRDDARAGRKSWMVKQLRFRRKLFVYFLRLLDYITYLRKNGKPMDFLLEEEASEVTQEPAKKKRKVDNGKSATELYEAPATEFSTREPSKNCPVVLRRGMVRQRYLKETKKNLFVDKDLPWWTSGWEKKIKPNKFVNEHVKKMLDGLEEDSADEA